MKITDLRVAPVHMRYSGGLRNTHHAWTGKTYLLVEVRTDAGYSGIGEVYCDGGAAPRVMAAVLEDELKPQLVGKDPRLISALHDQVTRRAVLSGRPSSYVIALAGVDIALWDILGKLAGQPVYRLLGGYATSVPVYGSGGMYGPTVTPESLAAEMAAAVGSGHGGVKIKAAGAPLAEDLERARAVRRAIGDARLMIDAMFLPTVPEAVRLARALEGLDIHFLEAPTRATDLRGWRQIAAATSVPLSGPELEADVEIMRDFVVEEAAYFMQFDVCLAGGITAGRRLAAIASAFARPVTLHCAASAVGLAASAHLGAAVPNCDSLECHLLHRGLRDVMWRSGWTLANGMLSIPERPGLGIDVDFDSLLEGAASE